MVYHRAAQPAAAGIVGLRKKIARDGTLQVSPADVVEMM